MTDQTMPKPASKRKAGYFVGFILLLILGFSGGWYWASGKLDQTVTDFSAGMKRDGKSLICSNQLVRGYPFRLGIFCDSVAYEDPASGILVSGNALRSAAQLYRPGHVVAEVDAPFEVSMPGFAPMTLDWANLKSSANIGTSGFQRMSIVADELKISANDFGERDLLGSLSQLQFHARPSPNDAVNDLDVAFSGEQWVIDDNGANQIEPIAFSLLFDLEDGLQIVQTGQDLISVLKANGGVAALKEFMIKTEGGGRFLVSGPLEINRKGQLSGDLVLEFDDPQKLVAYSQSVFPPLGESLAQFSQYLDAFAKQSDGMVKIRDLKISIRKGKILLGFFEIGKIPRLF